MPFGFLPESPFTFTGIRTVDAIATDVVDFHFIVNALVGSAMMLGKTAGSLSRLYLILQVRLTLR